MAEQKSLSEQARKQLLDRIEGLIEDQDLEQLRTVLSTSRSADVAEVVEVLDEIARQILFDLLDAKEAGEVLEKIDHATRSEVVEDLSSDELTDILATLPPDEAADVVADLSEEQSEEVLDHIGKTESDEIEKLLSYAEDSAGGIMTSVLAKVTLGATIGDAIEQFRQADPEDDVLNVFVVDEAGVYQGVLDVRNLLRHDPDTVVSTVLQDILPAMDVNADQEEIANTFRKNDLIVTPVIDEKGVLVGRITVDDVVDVMEEEAEEDALVMAGTHPAELETPQIFRAATVRLPWLLTCMFGALFSALIFFRVFEGNFSPEIWACIVMFVPAIAAIGGNSGMQTSTIVLRGLATGDLAALDLGQVFVRESRIGLIVAGICAFLAGLVAMCWLHLAPPETGGLGDNVALILGFSVGLAMFCAILVSTSMGLILPFVFRRLGIDPAISSGPLVTTANDTLSYLVYFSLALVLLENFGK